MKFGIFYEHQLPRPWTERAEYELFQNSLTQVELADGRILDTGLCHYEQASARRVYAYGVGPSVDGLFAQSNLGIVTQIGVWLMPRPQAFCAFFIRAPGDRDLETLGD